MPIPARTSVQRHPFRSVTADCGGRYALKNWDAREQRKAHLAKARVAPLEQLVNTIRQSIRSPTDVPSIDPCDGGTRAEILLLLEAPGRRAIETGFVSMNNPDRTAANLLALVQDAGIDRRHVLMWNVVPWYLGSPDHKKVRPANHGDIIVASPYLQELVTLLPHLRACVLFGKAAQQAEPQLDALLAIPIFRSPHPSPVAFAVNMSYRQEALRALRHAAAAAASMDTGHRRKTQGLGGGRFTDHAPILQTRIQLDAFMTSANDCVSVTLGRVTRASLHQLLQHKYDQAPVLTASGKPIGIIATATLGDLADQDQPLAENCIDTNAPPLPDVADLATLLGRFTSQRAALVADHGRWLGLITIADLNRHAFRGILYQALAQFEETLARLIENAFDDPWDWLKHVSDYDRVQLVGNWEVTKHNDVDLGPTHAASLLQLLKVIRADDALRRACGLSSKNKAKQATEDLPDIRNAVMHPVRPLAMSPKDVGKILHALEAIDDIMNALKKGA